ncbi:MAG: hypothetical protein JSW00_11585 [Thermoplasmata archaeon]|nr:MAG: hypothetical protein JSW00_11585 [Thermoplasmata archaeon]
MFANREEEFKILKEALSSKKPEFVIVYGRRRVGKTELLKQILQIRTDAIYFLGNLENEDVQCLDTDALDKLIGTKYKDKKSS